MNALEKAGFKKIAEGSDFVQYDRVAFYENCMACGKAYPANETYCPFCGTRREDDE